MKTAFILLIMTCSLFAGTRVHGQLFTHTDPGFNKVLVDTTVMTASEVTYLPGKKTNMHTHSSFFAYVLEGGKLKVEFADGSTEMLELKTGDNLYSGPEKPHRTENIGTSPVRMLLIELNEHPYEADKKMMKKS